MLEKLKSKINVGTLIKIFGVGLVILLPLRVYQYMKIMEAGTGFYSVKNASIPIFYIVLALACALPIVLSLSMKKGLEIDNSKKVRLGEGIAALLVAVTLIINAVEMFGNFSEIFYAFQPTKYTPNILKYLMKTGALAVLFEAIFAVVSMIYFILIGGSNIKGSSVTEYKFLAIAPLAWCICRIIHRFMRAVSYLKVSDLLLELLMIAFLMMFFLAFAQKMSGINGKGRGWKIYGYGFPAATLCLLCFIPRMIVAISGRSDLLANKSPVEYCDMAIALFIICHIIGKLQDKKALEQEKVEIQVKTQAEEPADETPADLTSAEVTIESTQVKTED